MSTQRDFLWIGGGRLLTALLALVSLRVSTTLLPPEQYGLLAMLITFQVFCGLFLVNPVGQYINRHTHVWADDGTLLARLQRYRRYVLLAGVVGAVVTGVWAVLQPLPWPERLLQMAMVAVVVVAATWNATSVSLLNMLGQRAASVLWACATAVVSLSLSWLFVVVSADLPGVPFGGGLAWFAGQACGLTIGALGAGYVVRRHLPAPPAGDWPLVDAGAIRTYILPLAVATGFMWWLLSGHRLLLEQHWGLAALGSVAVGLALVGQLWSLCESLAMQFLFPLYYRRIANATPTEGSLAFSDLLNTLGPAYLVLAAATLLSASALLTVFVASAYADVRVFVLLGALIECSRVLANVLTAAAQVERRMGALILPYAVGAFAVTGGLLYAAQGGADITQAVTVLAGAGGLTLLMMAWRMRVALAFRLDLPRWGAAGVLLALALLLAWQMPLLPASPGAALAVLAVVGLLASVSLLALLWKNPGTQRLLAVRLQTGPVKE